MENLQENSAGINDDVSLFSQILKNAIFSINFKSQAIEIENSYLY